MYKKDDLNRELDSLEKDTRERLGSIFSSLQSDLDSAQKARKEAEDAAKEAEKKYGAALELQKEQYSRAIQEIFEEPKRDLIKKITKYSLGGIIATLAAAISSFFLTPVFLTHRIDSLAYDVKYFLSKVEGVQGDIDSLAYDVKYFLSKAEGIQGDIRELHERFSDLDFQNSVPDRGVLEIIHHLNENKEKFSGYRTNKDLERAYKIMPVASSTFPSGFYYYQYRIAFRNFGLDDVPTARELQEWDVEAYLLYDNWYNFTKDRGHYRVPARDKARKWDSFKSSGDSTRYRWEYSETDITFSRISQYVMRKRDVFLEQWRRNKKLMP